MRYGGLCIIDELAGVAGTNPQPGFKGIYKMPSNVVSEGGRLSVRPDRIRDAFKVVYLSRERFRTTRRDFRESLKLAGLARELSSAYLEVVEWDGWRRVLALKT
ncbi:MAG: hypothetical protein QXS42_00710 [Zestosphaera sp.]